MRDSNAQARKFWLGRKIVSISMRKSEEQEETAGEYRVISGERWEIYMFGRPKPTRLLLEWL
jgi:hypothetical protein